MKGLDSDVQARIVEAIREGLPAFRPEIRTPRQQVHAGHPDPYRRVSKRAENITRTCVGWRHAGKRANGRRTNVLVWMLGLLANCTICTLREVVADKREDCLLDFIVMGLIEKDPACFPLNPVAMMTNSETDSRQALTQPLVCLPLRRR